MKTITTHCLEANTIVEIAEDMMDQGVNASSLAFAVCTGRMRSVSDDCRALLLSPTVPLVKQHLEIAKDFHILRPCLIIGTSEVDNWKKEQWQDVVMRHNMIITTPQLFLDALDSKHLHLSSF